MRSRRPPPDLDRLLDEGLRRHQAGDLRQAEKLYRQALVQAPEHGDALHLLGVVAYQKQDYDKAVKLARRAIQINPGAAMYHNTLGLALQECNDLKQAIKCFEKALALAPDFVEALNNLGNAHRVIGHVEQARACLHRALALQPGFADAHISLGKLMQSAGRNEEAFAHYQRALELVPHSSAVHNQLGLLFVELGNLDMAIKHYRQALETDSNYAPAYTNLGSALSLLGCHEEALRCLNRAQSLQPKAPLIHYNLGNVYRDLQRPAEAMSHYRRALRYDSNLAEAHMGLAHTLLLTGHFEEGWKEYEWRWQMGRASRPSFQQPLWKGEHFTGRTLLLCAEQGLGDTIQFVRYAALAKQRGGTIVLACQQSLIHLLEATAGIDVVVPLTGGSALPRFDIWMPLLSLPRIFGTRLDTIPAEIPYLRTTQVLPPDMQDRLDRHAGTVRIGIVWAGRATHVDNRNRSCEPNYLARLSTTSNVTLFSLQTGERSLGTMHENMHFTIHDLAPGLKDFAVTAAVINQLDLVITVDTSVAHLSGALGKPTWIMLPFSPDWRWLMTRETTPWYPTARLFRQLRPGDWNDVLERIATELVAFAKNRTDTSDPGRN